MDNRVLAAVQALPDHERTVTTLFYIDGYSQGELADFLELPVTTVNSRLRCSRKRLKERMIGMVQENLHDKRPSRNEQLLKSVLDGVPRVSYQNADGGYEFTPFVSCLRSCYDALCMQAERNYAENFLRQVAENQPAIADDLEKAAQCLSEARTVKMHEHTGGYIPRHDDEQLLRLADPVARRGIAESALQARDKHVQAIAHIERVLAKSARS